MYEIILLGSRNYFVHLISESKFAIFLKRFEKYFNDHEKHVPNLFAMIIIIGHNRTFANTYKDSGSTFSSRDVRCAGISEIPSGIASLRLK